MKQDGGDADWIATEPYYDKEKQVWLIDVKKKGINGEIINTETKEYTIPMTEYEIEKKVEKFLNSPEKIFEFSTYYLMLYIDDHPYIIYFKDFADDVVIYDKYLTKENIYEDTSRPDSFVACSALDPKNVWTKYESNNFFYLVDMKKIADIDTKYDSSYPKKFLNEQYEMQIKKIEDEINEYRQIASSNPNKAYYVFIEPDMFFATLENKITNLFCTPFKKKILTCDIEDKENTTNQLLERLRYYHINIYGNIYNSINGRLRGGLSPIENNVLISEEMEQEYYNLFTGKKFKSEKDIFKETVNPITIMKQNWHGDISKLGDEAEIRFVPGFVEAYFKKVDFTISSSYNDLMPYLNIKELTPEILPSSTRLISKDEIEVLDKDDTYRAYNEIFARHGHDFKDEEYKFYFSLWDWYKPINGKTVTVEELTDIEKENYALIKSVIEEKQY